MMDKLEEANSRLLVRRQQYKESMPTSSAQLSTIILSIPELQKRFSERAKGCKETVNPEFERERIRKYQEREQWKALRESKTKNFTAYVKACGVPVRFLDVPIKKIETTKESCYVTGACGTGKTHLAISALKYFVQQIPCHQFVTIMDDYINAIFITVPELLMKIRSCFSLDKCEETIVNKYSNVPFLVLDDLGVEKGSEWALQTLYIIINNRYSNCLQTVITSNFSIEEIGIKLGDRIASRIAGMCDVVELTGTDRRL